MIRVGFTGTRHGMTKYQVDGLVRHLKQLYYDSESNLSLSHGDCVGADSEAHHVALQFPFITKVIIHPPLNNTHRAYCIKYVFQPPVGMEIVELTPQDYLVRNQNIVNQSDVLIAAPKETQEILRSGTWSTIRKARNKGLEVIVLDREKARLPE